MLRMRQRGGGESAGARRRRSGSGSAATLVGRQLLLVRLAGLLAPHGADDPEATAAILEQARRATSPLLDAADSVLVYETFLARALVTMALEGELDPSGLRETLTQARNLTAVSPAAIAFRALGDPAIVAMPLDVATKACLTLLRGLAPVREVRLSLGESNSDDAGAVSVTIEAWRRPCAVLACLPEEECEAECLALAQHAGALLGGAFERASLIEGNVSRGAALQQSSERRLSCLGFDLHDGPLQDVALLGHELAGLRREVLAEREEGNAPAADLLTRLDDLCALVSFLDSDLREIAVSTDSPTVLGRPFAHAVTSAVRSFSARADIEPDLELSGDFAALTDSQRIALLRIVQESLSNVRDHSGARNVHIAITAYASHTEAVISDDGHGFVVADAMRAAAHAGRMGLVGMGERIRMLGGRCDIQSSPGAGTTIEVSLARWVPAPFDAEPALVGAVTR